MLMYLVNILFVVFANDTPLQSIGQEWLISMVAITAGRLVLNLRNSVRNPNSSDTNNSSGQRPSENTTEDIELGQYTTVFTHNDDMRGPSRQSHRARSPRSFRSSRTGRSSFLSPASPWSRYDPNTPWDGRIPESPYTGTSPQTPWSPQRPWSPQSIQQPATIYIQDLSATTLHE